MSLIKLKMLLLIVSLLLALTFAKGYSVCDHGLETLSQGNVRLTSKSFNKFKKSEKTFILAVSDSECAICCNTEQTLQYFVNHFEKHHTDRSSKVKVARLDSAKYSDLAVREGLFHERSMAFIALYHEGVYYKYDTVLDKE